MYEEFFNLSAAPFRLNPDPKFFFGSRSHNKAMAYLHYGLRQGEGFIVVTGEIGAGKSMLIGHLIDQLDRTGVVAAHLLTTNLEPSALLAHILSAFRIEASGEGPSAELEALEDFLFHQMNRGRRVLLIVDEAQNLPTKTIEELRMLSNMNYDGTPLFQVFLVGQPQFREILARPDMEQFRQRVIASYHLDPLTDEETKEYIRHRLSVVGWTSDPVITNDAHAAIFAETGGVPRKINKLCNRVFLHCASEKLHSVDSEVVRFVSADLKNEDLSSVSPPSSDVISHEPAAPRVTTKPPVAEENAVVLPFAVRKATASPESPRESEVTDTADVATDQTGTGWTSTFDRLRSRRATAPSPSHDEDAPSAATLEDVAQAIAHAAAQTSASADVDVPPAAITETSAAPGAAIQVGEQEFVGDADRWRAPVVKSLVETRDELKYAHGSVDRLRRQLSDFDRRRREKRQKIAANLMRAETLLAEIKNAWR